MRVFHQSSLRYTLAKLYHSQSSTLRKYCTKFDAIRFGRTGDYYGYNLLQAKKSLCGLRQAVELLCIFLQGLHGDIRVELARVDVP